MTTPRVPRDLNTHEGRKWLEYIARKVEDVGIDSEILYAQERVKKQYGDKVSVFAKAKELIKYGGSSLATSAGYTTVWTNGGDETYLGNSVNTIKYISSASGSDTGDIAIEGHTDASGEKTFYPLETTLAGQTKTDISSGSFTGFNRSSRIANLSGTDWVGPIYLYEDDTVIGGVPQTASKIHLIGTAQSQQSEKTASTLSNVDYYFISLLKFSIIKKTGSAVDFELQIRRPGQVFRRIDNWGVNSNSATVPFPIKPFIIVPKNSDFRIRAKADTANTQVAASMYGYLASVI